MNKLFYTAPETEVIIVRFEGNILTNSFNGDRNQTPQDSGEVDF